ncbi:MAG TPA: cation:proton antiporter [Bryobacteraceae bacterium]|nr:cation:proton antiporter [Bryobacteraceae bacterium]
MLAATIPARAPSPDESQILGLLGGLLVLAFFSNRVSRISRIPDLLILMLTGVLLGPVLGWLQTSELSTFTEYLGTLALILILFEAGTEIRLRDTLQHFPPGLLFAVLSFGTSFAAVALTGRWLLGLSTHNSLLFGAVLGCVSGTIVIPVLQQFEIRGPVAVVLVLEAALGDVIGVITVGSLTAIAEGDPLLSGLLKGLLTRTFIAIAAAVAAGLLWSRVRSRFTPDRFGSVLQVGVVLGVFGLTRLAGGSGLLGVLAFGLTLANVPGKGGASTEESGAQIFHSDLSFLVRSFFFVLLGASVELIDRSYILATFAILGGLVIARIAAVLGLRMTMRTIGKSERELLSTLLPRGLVNAVLAIQVGSRISTLGFLPAMTFTVILITNLLVVLATWRTRPSGTVPAPR